MYFAETHFWLVFSCMHVVFVQSLLKHHPGGRTKGAGATTRGNPGEIWASILAASNSWKWGWFWVLVVDGCRSLVAFRQRCLRSNCKAYVSKMFEACSTSLCVVVFVLILMIYMLLTSSRNVNIQIAVSQHLPTSSGLWQVRGRSMETSILSDVSCIYQALSRVEGKCTIVQYVV